MLCYTYSLLYLSNIIIEYIITITFIFTKSNKPLEVKMNILVCVKQVPDTAEIQINPLTNTLNRAGVPNIVNPYDSYALELAAKIKDHQADTNIIVLSMGPNQAENALRSCLAVGGDKAYLVTDKKFGGSDTFATSYILSEAILYIESQEGKIDLIFCGKQAIDGDTAQVGPQIAEHLHYPQLTYVLEAEIEKDTIVAKRETNNRYEITSAKLPCVITATKPADEPRIPTLKNKIAAKRAEIVHITSKDLKNINPKQIGLDGSPTKVKSIKVAKVQQKGILINEGTTEKSAEKLVKLLYQDGRIGGDHNEKHS